MELIKVAIKAEDALAVITSIVGAIVKTIPSDTLLYLCLSDSPPVVLDSLNPPPPREGPSELYSILEKMATLIEPKLANKPSLRSGEVARVFRSSASTITKIYYGTNGIGGELYDRIVEIAKDLSPEILEQFKKLVNQRRSQRKYKRR